MLEFVHSGLYLVQDENNSINPSCFWGFWCLLTQGYHCECANVITFLKLKHFGRVSLLAKCININFNKSKLCTICKTVNTHMSFMAQFTFILKFFFIKKILLYHGLFSRDGTDIRPFIFVIRPDIRLYSSFDIKNHNSVIKNKIAILWLSFHSFQLITEQTKSTKLGVHL